MQRALNWLFLDLNSYFASCEQEARPELRGKPIAIVPVQADTTCCIAVSYQAKSYGIRTGTSVAQAKTLCPQLQLVEARPGLYVEFHHRIKAAIERCVPVHTVLSCDEFACQLTGDQCRAERATELAYAIKAELRNLGTTLRCSIGLGPNRLLAKIAGEMQRPDGLMVLEPEALPQSLHCLALTDIPGVGRRMAKRLNASGIQTVEQLCGCSRSQMSRLWGGVVGERMWLWLRGEDFAEPAARPPQSFSRQHILPPNCRNPERARAIAIKMLHSLAMRLRRQGLWATGLWMQVGYLGKRYAFQGSAAMPPCQDPYTLQAHLLDLWRNASADPPADLTLAVTGLVAHAAQDMFDSATAIAARDRVAGTIDKLNKRYGIHSVYLGSIADVRHEAPMRISFGPPPPLEDFRPQ